MIKTFCTTNSGPSLKRKQPCLIGLIRSTHTVTDLYQTNTNGFITLNMVLDRRRIKWLIAISLIICSSSFGMNDDDDQAENETGSYSEHQVYNALDEALIERSMQMVERPTQERSFVEDAVQHFFSLAHPYLQGGISGGIFDSSELQFRVKAYKEAKAKIRQQGLDQLLKNSSRKSKNLLSLSSFLEQQNYSTQSEKLILEARQEISGLIEGISTVDYEVAVGSAKKAWDSAENLYVFMKPANAASKDVDNKHSLPSCAADYVNAVSPNGSDENLTPLNILKESIARTKAKIKEAYHFNSDETHTSDELLTVEEKMRGILISSMNSITQSIEVLVGEELKQVEETRRKLSELIIQHSEQLNEKNSEKQCLSPDGLEQQIEKLIEELASPSQIKSPSKVLNAPSEKTSSNLLDPLSGIGLFRPDESVVSKRKLIRQSSRISDFNFLVALDSPALQWALAGVDTAADFISGYSLLVDNAIDAIAQFGATCMPGGVCEDRGIGGAAAKLLANTYSTLNILIDHAAALLFLKTPETKEALAGLFSKIRELPGYSTLLAAEDLVIAFTEVSNANPGVFSYTTGNGADALDLPVCWSNNDSSTPSLVFEFTHLVSVIGAEVAFTHISATDSSSITVSISSVDDNDAQTLLLMLDKSDEEPLANSQMHVYKKSLQTEIRNKVAKKIKIELKNDEIRSWRICLNNFVIYGDKLDNVNR